KKSAAISYLKYMTDEAARRFDSLRVQAPAKANDAQFVALWTAFDDDHNPDPSAYEDAIRAALGRYEESPVSKMGRRLDWRDAQQYELETRVAWVILPGAGKRLVYVDRAFSAAYQLSHQSPQPQGRLAPNRSSAYDSGTQQLSLQDDATWS